MFASVALLTILIVIEQGNSQNHGDLRLVQQDVKNSAFTEGRLEIYVNSTWGSICADNFDMHDADVACKQLGFSGALEVATSFHTPYGRGREGPVWLDEVECKEDSLLHILSCSHVRHADIDCDHFSDVAIKCSSEPPTTQPDDLGVRLVGGEFKSQGMLEVYCNNSWAPVCPPQGTVLGKSEEDAICRQLGYTESVHYLQRGGPGVAGISPVSLQDYECSENAHDLASCSATCELKANVNSGSSAVQMGCIYLECTHSVPYGSLRLSNGSDITPGALSGRLEVFRNGKWETVCSRNFDLEAANISCQQFGFPSALYYGLSEEVGYGESDEDVPILSGINCSPHDKLVKCANRVEETNCTHSEDVAIFCRSHSVVSDSGLEPTAKPGRKLPLQVFIVLIVAPCTLFIVLCACLAVYSIHFKLVPYDTMKKPASHGLYFTEYEGSCLTLNETNLEAMLESPASLKLQRSIRNKSIRELAVDKELDSKCSTIKYSPVPGRKDHKDRYTSMPTQHPPLPPLPPTPPSPVPHPSILGRQPASAQLPEDMKTPSPNLHRKFTITSNLPGPSPTSPMTGRVPPPLLVKRNLMIRRKSEEQLHTAIDMTQPSLADECTKASSSSNIVEDSNPEEQGMGHEEGNQTLNSSQAVQMRPVPQRGIRKLSRTLSQISDVNLEAVAINNIPMRDGDESSPTADSRTNQNHRVSFKLE